MRDKHESRGTKVNRLAMSKMAVVVDLSCFSASLPFVNANVADGSSSVFGCRVIVQVDVISCSFIYSFRSELKENYYDKNAHKKN